MRNDIPFYISVIDTTYGHRRLPVPRSYRNRCHPDGRRYAADRQKPEPAAIFCRSFWKRRMTTGHPAVLFSQL